MPTRSVRAPVKHEVSVGDLCRSHPILPIVLTTDCQTTQDSLPAFIQHELEHATNNKVPLTLAEFYHDYTQWRIRLALARPKHQPQQRYLGNANDTVRQLSRMAFMSAVRGGTITHELVLKLLSPGSYVDSTVVDVEFQTFGILERDENKSEISFSSPRKGRGRITYRFREQIVRDYLAARHILVESVRLVVSGKSHEVTHGQAHEAMKRLPATGELWRITFALLNDDTHTRAVQGDMLSALINTAKSLEGLNSFDVTQLCVEIIYESRNADLLTDHIDEFTLNQTLNYSHAYVPRARLAYSLAALGYFVRASDSVYGLHMTSFGLDTVERVRLLADPVNAVSDNYLQVLNLSGNSLGRDGLSHLQRFLVKASFLTHLDLSACVLGPGGAAILAEYFMCLPLVYLNLSENSIGDTGLLKILKHMRYLTELEWLDLSCNELTDTSLCCLGNQVTCLQRLRMLDVRHNSMSDAALTSLSWALVTLPHLSHIMLAQNSGLDANASQLVTHAWRSKSLKHININLNEVPPEGVLGLRRVTLSRDLGDIPSVDMDNSTATAATGTADVSAGESSALDASGYVTDDTFHSGASMTLNESRRDLTTLSGRLHDSHQASFDVLSPWEMDKSASMDLLAGRPDRLRAVPLRRKRSRSAITLPRVRDLRRSWHGVTAGIRDSIRLQARPDTRRRSAMSRQSIVSSGGAAGGELSCEVIDETLGTEEKENMVKGGSEKQERKHLAESSESHGGHVSFNNDQGTSRDGNFDSASGHVESPNWNDESPNGNVESHSSHVKLRNKNVPSVNCHVESPGVHEAPNDDCGESGHCHVEQERETSSRPQSFAPAKPPRLFAYTEDRVADTDIDTSANVSPTNDDSYNNAAVSQNIDETMAQFEESIHKESSLQQQAMPTSPDESRHMPENSNSANNSAAKNDVTVTPEDGATPGEKRKRRGSLGFLHSLSNLRDSLRRSSSRLSERLGSGRRQRNHDNSDTPAKTGTGTPTQTSTAPTTCNTANSTLNNQTPVSPGSPTPSIPHPTADTPNTPINTQRLGSPLYSVTSDSGSSWTSSNTYSGSSEASPRSHGDVGSSRYESEETRRLTSSGETRRRQMYSETSV